jgi:hypothetical protein
VSDRDQDLRDERALRLELEQRLLGEVERTALWRRRAEERAERIKRLEAERGRRRRKPRRVKNPERPLQHPAGSLEDAADGTRGHGPSYAVVKAVMAVGTRWLPLSAEVTALDPTPANLAVADLAIVDRDGWSSLSDSGRRTLAEASRADATSPLVFLASESNESAPAELRGALALALNPTFTVTWGWPDRSLPPMEIAPTDLEAPSPEVVVAASRGRAFGPGLLDGERASVAAHRWAHRYHAPWVRMAQILAAAGVRARPPLPSIGAILVSNRPANVVPQLDRLFSQTRRPDEVVVGLHGIKVPHLDECRSRSPVPVHVVELDPALTLGAALNVCVARSGASVLAKIDDDDHYGPAFLEDAIHELVTSGAGIAGKAAMFMHRADTDTTLLRRAGQEHVVVTGTMPGGSLVMHRRVWDAVGFPHRPRFVDAFLLDAARRIGERAVSGHPFEFCLMRHGSSHTFAASNERYAAGAIEIGAGFEAAWVEVPDLWVR